MADFFSRALAAGPPSPQSGFLEKALVYIPNRGRPRSANQSKRNARRCQKYAENQVQAVLAQAKQTLEKLPCLKTQDFCDMVGQMTNKETTNPATEQITANVLRFTQAVARQHRCFVLRELFHGCDITFLKKHGLEAQAIRYARTQPKSHDEDHPFFTGIWKQNERETISTSEANAIVAFARSKLVLVFGVLSHTFAGCY
jgi:hypothetical protein